MNSEYYISSPLYGKYMALQEEQFKDLKRAKKRLSSSHAINHKYMLVEANYRLIVEALTEFGNLHATQASAKQQRVVKSRLNACVNNYILSGRTYTSQLKRHIQACVPHDRNEVNRVTRRMDAEYQRSFAYRFVDSLYDYVSYYGLSVHAIQIDSFEQLENGRVKRAFQVNAFIERDYLGGPTDFRASVLKETPRRVNLIWLLKAFMESLCNIHKLATSITEGVTEQSHTLVREFIHVFVGEHRTPTNNLFVVHAISGAQETIYDQFPISMYVDEHAALAEYR